MIEMKLEGKILLNDTAGKRCILLLDCVVYRNKYETGRVNLESRVAEGELYEKIQEESFREKYMQEWIATLDKKLCDTIMKMQEHSNTDKKNKDGK